MYILLVCWVVLGLTPVLFSTHDLMLATGRAGAPGRLTVISCQALGEGRYDCKGRFVPDDDALKTKIVQASPDSRAGQSFRGRLDVGSGRVVRTGTAGVLAQFAVIGLTPLVYAGLPYTAMFALGVRRGRRVAGRLGVVVAAASLVLVVIGVAAAYA
ncbi:hypothetical protein DQ384_01315 [Sphaerisporangium album]|uniref:Uncharacterized protein n=1 Tax=Sphaerisporangium album TaxID=509200 RepID=A0A367FTI8_9ACTN|nr:hypothetical protein [Sphaerisporangium album]RCG33112.1 hypothetical protein DQ384_01315 [Sphaerisporangium album]